MNFLNNKIKPKNDYRPFELTILPNWHNLMMDYWTHEEIDVPLLQEKIKEKESTSEYNIFDKGIKFTVLDDWLVYDNNYHTFHRGVFISKAIEEIEIDIGNIALFYPEIKIIKLSDGFDIFITTPESKKLSFSAGDNKDLLKVTTIPFPLFMSDPKEIDIRRELNKYDWSFDENYEAFKSDFVLLNTGEMIKHKYFTVYYKFI